MTAQKIFLILTAKVPKCHMILQNFLVLTAQTKFQKIFHTQNFLVPTTQQPPKCQFKILIPQVFLVLMIVETWIQKKKMTCGHNIQMLDQFNQLIPQVFLVLIVIVMKTWIQKKKMTCGRNIQMLDQFPPLLPPVPPVLVL